MADLDALLKDDEPAPTDSARLHSLLADQDAQEAAPDKPLQLSPAEREAAIKQSQSYQFGNGDLPWYERAARGAVDPLLGAGQLVQNVAPDSVLNAGRKITDPIINAIAGGDKDTSTTSTADFNKGVRQQDKAYQGQRSDNGQSGIDWWRIGGTIANPVSWIGGGPAGQGVKAAVSAGAKAGAFQALLQPVNSEGSFLWDKGLQAGLGAAFGGTLGGAFAAMRPVFNKAVDAVGKIFHGADDATQSAAAARMADDALHAVGADPNRVDPIVRDVSRQEFKDALKAGVAPDPTVMANKADASALPVPIELSRGMASGDPLQRSWEINNGKRPGYEQIANIFTNANRNLVRNLDALGAKDANSTFDFSQQAIAKLKEIDDGLSSQVDAAYQQVRDSAGRPALMNHQAFTANAREALKREQVSEFLPKEIRDTMNALELGNSPLTVDIAQQLDKVWGRAQASTQDGNAKVAIGIARRALSDAPVDDTLGAQSMAAYQQAKKLARERFALHDSNPAMKAVVDGKAEPDKFFQKYLEAANVSEINGLKQVLGPELSKSAQNTMVDQLKRAAVGSKSDDFANFGQAAYNKLIHGQVTGPRFRALFSDAPDTLNQLYRVGRVAERVHAYPVNHSVNTSNSAVTAANMIEDAVDATVGRSTLGGLVMFGRDYAKKKAAETAEKQAIQSAVKPGVTKDPLPPKPQSKTARRLSDLVVRSGATAAPDSED